MFRIKGKLKEHYIKIYWINFGLFYLFWCLYYVNTWFIIPYFMSITFIISDFIVFTKRAFNKRMKRNKVC